MHISLIILTPILISLWIYFLIIITETFFHNPSKSLELNILNTNSDNENTILKGNGSSVNKIRSNETGAKYRKSFHVPKFMLELYEKNRREGKNLQNSDVVKSLIPSHSGIPACINSLHTSLKSSWFNQLITCQKNMNKSDSINDNEVFETLSQNHLLVFNIPKSDENEKFTSAELKILTLLDVKQQTDVLEMKRSLKVSIYDDSMKRLLNFQEVPLHHINNTWVSFNVTEPVGDVLRNKKNIFSIVITITAFYPEFKENLKLSLMPEEENFEHDYPILLLSYSSLPEKHELKDFVAQNLQERERVKRNIEEDYEEETNKLWDDEFSTKKAILKKFKKVRNGCKRRPLYVDFAEISYDSWIVQPKGYEAYQCQGRCFYPVADHLNPTKHAIVQAMLHSVAPSRVSRSCCVPTLLEPISILYVDINGVLTYRYAYKDMVVVECGCR